MNSISALPKVTHTAVTGDIEPIHKELQAQFDRLLLTPGKKFPNRTAGRDNSEGSTFQVVSPSNTALCLGEFTDASAAAVDAAIRAARKSFAGWSALGWRERVRFMEAARRELDRRQFEISAAISLEVGKPRLDAFGEVGEALGMFDQYIGYMRRFDGYEGAVLPAGDKESARTVFRPYGVFAAITPFNFPVALPTNLILGALLTGNTLVFKPSPAGARSGQLLMEVFEAAALPEGVLNLVQGAKAGEYLANASGVDGYAFVGSHKVGMDLMRKAAAGPYPRPVIAEMGGKNPAYVSGSADVEVAARGVAKSAFGGAGQKCTCCSVAYVHTSLYDQFVEALKAEVEKLQVGNSAVDRSVNVGPLINDAAVSRYLDAVEHGRRHGRVITGGARITEGDAKNGRFVEPTIVDGLAVDDALVSTELFAPFLILQKFDDLEEAIDRGNRVIYGLSAGFYGADATDRDTFLNKVEAGILYLNRPHGATTGGWPGIQVLTGWKGSGSSGMGSMGEHFLTQFMRQQCRTIKEA